MSIFPKTRDTAYSIGSTSEPDRYDSAIGWEPPEETALKRAREKVRSETALYPSCDAPIQRSLRVRTKILPLFGELWREREVAVLIGEPGAGKSILATQIAETIARGVCGLPQRKVLYFDLERSKDQFDELYSAQLRSGERLAYRFSRNFRRADFEPHYHMTPTDGQSYGEYFRSWINHEISNSECRISIIDNITYAAARRNMVRTLQTLKYIAIQENVSILVLAYARTRKHPAPITLADVAGGSGIAELADSVFAIGQTTLAPDLRYLKHLKARSRPVMPHIPLFRIRRMPTAVLDTEPLTDVSGVSVIHPQGRPPELPSAPTISNPTGVDNFLGLDFLSLSDEEELISPRTPPHIFESQRQKRIRNDTVEMLMSKEYNRFVLGR